MAEDRDLQQDPEEIAPDADDTVGKSEDEESEDVDELNDEQEEDFNEQ